MAATSPERRRPRRWWPASVASILLTCCLGCSDSNADPANNDVGEDETDATEEVTSESNETATRDADSGGGNGDAAAPTVTRADLNQHIALHDPNGEAEWYHGANPDAEPTGAWVSQDEDRVPLVFEADGTFRCGVDDERSAEQMAVGRYAISSRGRVVALAGRLAENGEPFYIGMYFDLQNGALVGPRGPLPQVEWRRVPEAP